MKHTAKKCILLLAGLALAAVLSGCTFFDSSVEQLFTLPRMAEEYTGLSQQLDSLIAQGYEYAPPSGGRNIQSVQMVDLEDDGRQEALVFLRRSADENKDQTYFLYMLGQHALSRAMFPIGGMTKPELRRIAAENNIPVSQKKDSTGVCFIGERNFKKFLMQYLPAQPGDMRTLDGKVVGHHDGLMYYTLGQRRGLGIGGSGDGRRWFVVGKDLQNNVLLVEQGEDSPLLYSDAAECELPSWAAGHAPVEPGERLECKVRLRHRQPPQDAYLALTDDGFRLDFAQKQRAVTPGQAAVVYVGDYCLGGGTVRAAL